VVDGGGDLRVGLGEREGECGAVGHIGILERLESFCPVVREGRPVSC
jgi:hypothetical protein